MELGQPPPPRFTDRHFSDRRTSLDTSYAQARSDMPGPANGQRPIAIHPSTARGSAPYGSGLAAARSPPKTKSTSHVPCKFYPQGTCQAGAACQFSHDLDPTTQNAPCKYFSRGSCKFGQSCALMHVLPDGRIINRPPRSAQAGYGRRAASGAGMYNGLRAGSVSVNAQEVSYGPPDQYMYQGQDPAPAYTHQPTSPFLRPDLHLSNVSSPYGSPPNGEPSAARSPPRVGLSARDAPLPSSWDSQGVSQAARNGPYAASVPGRFGLESPPASYTNGSIGISPLRENGAYGDTANLDGVLHGLGSSPRASEPLSFAKRPLHSERFARNRVPISSSLDVRTSQAFQVPEDRNSEDTNGSDDQDSDGVGEDLLPSSLHDLLPIDKVRRSSKNGLSLDTTDDSGNPWARRGTNPKGGALSPQSASPSRYSAFFGSRMSSSTSIAGLKANGSSEDAYNSQHVGSPLRPSNLRTSSTPQSAADGMSMLTSQLQRAKFGPDSNQSAPNPSHKRGERIEEESDTMFSFDNDGEDDANGEDYDGGMTALAGSQIMGASQTLGGSVAEPRSNVGPGLSSLSNGFNSSGGAWGSGSPAGVIGGGRTK